MQQCSKQQCSLKQNSWENKQKTPWLGRGQAGNYPVEGPVISQAPRLPVTSESPAFWETESRWGNDWSSSGVTPHHWPAEVHLLPCLQWFSCVIVTLELVTNAMSTSVTPDATPPPSYNLDRLHYLKIHQLIHIFLQTISIVLCSLFYWSVTHEAGEG